MSDKEELEKILSDNSITIPGAVRNEILLWKRGEWCEHMREQTRVKIVNRDGQSRSMLAVDVVGKPGYCPICGIKRPAGL